MIVTEFRLTRFQFARSRVIGDSQVRIDQAHPVAVELFTDTGMVGYGFASSLFHPWPSQHEIERVFREEVWPSLRGETPAAWIHRLHRPRGGNLRPMSLPFGEAIGHALWDLAAKEAGLPLWRYLGGTEPMVRTYASGLDFHLSDSAFQAFFAAAHAQGYRAFKIKVGHKDLAWDLNRLALLQEATGGGTVMADANEAWSPKEALMRLDAYRREGFDLLWIEDPCLRDDFAGLAEVRRGAPWVLVNSGEYLDLRGKRLLIEAHGVDMLNIHGAIGDGLRAGWLAAEHGIPISLGNTYLELGVHLAAALPEANWMEYSFQNYNHLVEQPIVIEDGFARAPDRPGHGLVLSEAARREFAVPEPLAGSALPPAPRSSPIELELH